MATAHIESNLEDIAPIVLISNQLTFINLFFPVI